MTPGVAIKPSATYEDLPYTLIKVAGKYERLALSYNDLVEEVDIYKGCVNG